LLIVNTQFLAVIVHENFKMSQNLAGLVLPR